MIDRFHAKRITFPACLSSLPLPPPFSLPLGLFHPFLHIFPPIQLLQVALLEGQTHMPGGFLLQPPRLPVHPQLHEARVELAAGRKAQVAVDARPDAFWPDDRAKRNNRTVL